MPGKILHDLLHEDGSLRRRTFQILGMKSCWFTPRLFLSAWHGSKEESNGSGHESSFNDEESACGALPFFLTYNERNTLFSFHRRESMRQVYVALIFCLEEVWFLVYVPFMGIPKALSMLEWKSRGDVVFGLIARTRSFLV